MFTRRCIASIALRLPSAWACGRLAADGIRIGHDPGGTVADTLDKPTARGLKASPPWPDGGWVMINLPEHLTCRPSDPAILRWGDNRREGAALNPWKISDDGREAAMDVETDALPGEAVERADLKMAATKTIGVKVPEYYSVPARKRPCGETRRTSTMARQCIFWWSSQVLRY